MKPTPSRIGGPFGVSGVKEAAQAVGEIGKTALESAAKAAPLLMSLS